MSRRHFPRKQGLEVPVSLKTGAYIRDSVVLTYSTGNWRTYLSSLERRVGITELDVSKRGGFSVWACVIAKTGGRAVDTADELSCVLGKG